MKLESAFEREFCKRLKNLNPKEVIVLKLDSKQGIPDRQIIFRGRVVFLEFKQHKNAKRQPLQDYYVDLLNKEGFARFVYPENGEQVFEEVVRYLELVS